MIPDDKLAIESQASCGYVQDSYGRRVSWNGRVPTLTISPSVPEEYKIVIDAAAQTWNTAAGKTIIKIAAGNGQSPKAAEVDGKNMLLWMTDWPEDKNTTQGLTRLYFSNSSVYEADIKVNAKDFRYYNDQATDSSDIHLESLLIHEFGHMLGLKHYMEALTVMEPWLSPAFKRIQITEYDQQSLECEYGS